MHQLKLGIMTIQEIADWFGISKKSFNNRREKKLKELEYYAKFKVLYGKIDILEIYEGVYDKALHSKYGKIRDEIPKTWSPNGLDTSKRVSSVIRTKLNEELQLKEQTFYNYTLKGKTELYGKPYKSDGKLGVCTYMWAKQIADEDEIQKTQNHFVPLTEEEEQLRLELLEKYFGKGGHTLVDKSDYVESLIEEGEITEEEAWQYYKDITNFSTLYKEFLFDFQEAIGGSIKKVTQIKTYEQLEQEQQETAWNKN